MKKSITFIVNPKSGLGKQNQIKSLIENTLDRTSFDWIIEFTQRRYHAKEIAAQAVQNKKDMVVVVGGDGTVNEVASQLVNSDTILGILPAGSGNGLARHLGINMDLAQAIINIDNHEIKKIDVGVLNKNFFFNTAGIGFDALIADKFLNLKKRGLIAYIKTTLKAYFSYTPINYEITSAKGKITKQAFLIAFANSSQYGNHATIAPNAKIDDGLLEMCILKRFSLFSVPILAYRLFSGTIDKSNKMQIIKGSSFKVSPKMMSFAHIDGEPMAIGETVDIELIPKALKIAVPSKTQH